MENQAINILMTLGVPNEDSGVNDLTFKEAIGTIPLLAALEDHEDDFSNGVRVALSHIYDTFVDIGLDDRLRLIHPDDMRRVDQMMKNGEMDDLYEKIPAVKDLMEKEHATEFDTGVVLAIALAYDACHETETIEALAAPDPGDIIEAPNVPSPARELDIPPPAPEIRGTDLDALLLALNKNGVIMDDIKIQPQLDNETVRMSIDGFIGLEPSFAAIAKINAVFKAAGGRDIRLQAVHTGAVTGIGFTYEI